MARSKPDGEPHRPASAGAPKEQGKAESGDKLRGDGAYST